jgi:excisionase family DNA binding protein
VSEKIEKKKDHMMILTVRDVAAYLRMSETKVYRLVKERHLPAVRIGKSWRFRRDLLDDWLSQCTESGMEDRKPGTSMDPVAIETNKGDSKQ